MVRLQTKKRAGFGKTEGDLMLRWYLCCPVPVLIFDCTKYQMADIFPAATLILLSRNLLPAITSFGCPSAFILGRMWVSCVVILQLGWHTVTACRWNAAHQSEPRLLAEDEEIFKIYVLPDSELCVYLQGNPAASYTGNAGCWPGLTMGIWGPCPLGGGGTK